VDLGDEVAVDAIWDAWKAWAEENGHSKSTKQTLGRNLRAAVPHVRMVHARSGGQRERVYRGVGLRGLG
jgi:putative DNA primase/helicase